jgi:hypothetical protein
MAKGQKRSGREPKKPKSAKKPEAPPVSQFSQLPGTKKPMPKTGGG